MSFERFNNRANDELRPIEFSSPYYNYAEGSCLVKCGNTEVLCVATVDDNLPPHLRGKKQGGWITAEYNMLPRSSPERIRRERSKVGGRTQEIQRLIGRSLRSICSLDLLPECSFILDCDVIRADGGTRTASISGAFIALVQAIRYAQKKGKIGAKAQFPIKDYLSAISVGIFRSMPLLDIDYFEDSQAEADMNLVLTSKSEIVEVQGTAEKHPFSQEKFSELIALGFKGCQEIHTKQKEILGELSW